MHSSSVYAIHKSLVLSPPCYCDCIVFSVQCFPPKLVTDLCCLLRFFFILISRSSSFSEELGNHFQLCSVTPSIYQLGVTAWIVIWGLSFNIFFQLSFRFTPVVGTCLVTNSTGCEPVLMNLNPDTDNWICNFGQVT